MQGGEDVVVSVLALSASRQKHNQTNANAPKIIARFYLSPQIRAGVGECAAFKTMTPPPIPRSTGVWVCACLCLRERSCCDCVCVVAGGWCRGKSLISVLALSAFFWSENDVLKCIDWNVYMCVSRCLYGSGNHRAVC